MRQLHRFYMLLKDKYKSAKILAKMSGLSESTISRILSGKADLDKRPARKLAIALEKDSPGSGVAFLITYLRDQLPKSLSSQITINLTGITPTASEPPVDNARLNEYVKLCQTYSLLAEEVQGSLVQLAEFCLQQPEHAKLIISILELIISEYRREIKHEESPSSQASGT